MAFKRAIWTCCSLALMSGAWAQEQVPAQPTDTDCPPKDKECLIVFPQEPLKQLTFTGPEATDLSRHAVKSIRIVLLSTRPDQPVAFEVRAGQRVLERRFFNPDDWDTTDCDFKPIKDVRLFCLE